jgi:hypothetical protein
MNIKISEVNTVSGKAFGRYVFSSRRLSVYQNYPGYADIQTEVIIDAGFIASLNNGVS